MTPEEYYNNLYLAHHGIKNQKWGQRRWQNKDGSLTPAGREHYGVGDPREEGSNDNYSNEYNDYDRTQAEEKEYQRKRQEKIDKFVRIGVAAAAVAVTAYALKKVSSKGKIEEISEDKVEDGKKKVEQAIEKIKSMKDISKIDTSKIDYDSSKYDHSGSLGKIASMKTGNVSYDHRTNLNNPKEVASKLSKYAHYNNKTGSMPQIAPKKGISDYANLNVSKLKSQPGNFNFSRDKTEAKKAAAFLENLNKNRSSSSGGGLSSFAKMDLSKLKSQPGNFNFSRNATASNNLASIASKAASGKSTAENAAALLEGLNKDLLKRK